MIWLPGWINRSRRSSRPPWGKVRWFCRVCQRPRASRCLSGSTVAGVTSDGGILLLAAIEQRLKIAERLAACLEDRRDPDRVVHRFVAQT
jgi:hypothetical protein